MILGNPKKIDLSISSFRAIRSNNNLYIDKTKFIENFLNDSNSVQLIVRQRRLGKTLNMDTLKCFLTDKEDNRNLFEGTYIENSSVWEMLNSVPVFYFDFKNLRRESYKEQIRNQIIEQIYNYIDVDKLNGFSKFSFNNYLNDKGDNPEGLLILTKIVYSVTGKRSYILIDEYDKLLTDNYNTDSYESIKEYETSFLSAGLKGNDCLQKAIMTGVLRVSRESMLSGLNNLVTYDMFSDKTFTTDFGLTEEEIDALDKTYHFNRETVREWYNGIRVSKTSLFNIYSVLSYVQDGEFKNFWGRSGVIDIILDLMNEDRQNIIMRLLNGESVEAYLNDRISLHELTTDPDDSLFYSMLVQAGYLSLEEINTEANYGTIKIPNKELTMVWKEFILRSFVKKGIRLKTLFSNTNDIQAFNQDVEYFLSDRLSYFDIVENEGKTAEKIYHVFVLGLLSAYEDISYKKPSSNKESGDGRYDILFERKDFNIIFEFKSVADVSRLESAADEGLRQIDAKRYYADVAKDKPLIKTAIAFCGKKCSVKSSKHEW